MTQDRDKPGDQPVGQAATKDGSDPKVPLDEVELKALDEGMRNMFMMFEFHLWKAKRLALRQDKRYQARERLRQARENQDRPGRGKSTFVISVPTMTRILQHIKSLKTSSSHEVRRVMIKMYRYGLDFDETAPNVSRKTVHRYLGRAFKDLQIWTGALREPSLWTLKASYNLRRDARIARVNLENESFLIV